MIPLELTKQEKGWLNDTLATSHSIHIRIQLLNLVGEKLSDLSNRLLDGQVDVDATAEVTRSCSLSLLDARRTLAFESDSPTEGAIYLDRMIRVIYSVKVPQMNDWVDIPIFTGPITSLSRDDDVVNIEAQGKEALARGAFWRVFDRRKGANKVEVIRDILQDRCGENRFTFPELPNARLPRNVSFGREQSPWKAAQRLARSMNRHLFYDGRGVCRLRIYPSTPVFVFKDGTGGTVTSTPQVSYTTDELKNVVWVVGGVPKSAKKETKAEQEANEGKKKVDVRENKKPIEAYAVAPANHPVSPAKLGRGDTELFLLEVINESSIMKKSDAQALADRRLRNHLLGSVEVSFDALTIPFLEENDIVRVHTEQHGATFRLKQFSIPLVADNTMSIGYTKRMKIRKRGKRNKNKNRKGRNRR